MIFAILPNSSHHLHDCPKIPPVCVSHSPCTPSFYYHHPWFNILHATAGCLPRLILCLLLSTNTIIFIKNPHNTHMYKLCTNIQQMQHLLRCCQHHQLHCLLHHQLNQRTMTQLFYSYVTIPSRYWDNWLLVSFGC